MKLMTVLCKFSALQVGCDWTLSKINGYYSAKSLYLAKAIQSNRQTVTFYTKVQAKEVKQS